MLPTPGLHTVVSDLQFPEGPAYDGKGNIYCSNCQADYITCLTVDGEITTPYRANHSSAPPYTFRKSNGMTFNRDGALWVCDFGRNAIVSIRPDGEQILIADQCDGQPFRAPNDLAFDASGNLYFTDPGGSGRDNPIGSVYRVEADTNKVRRVAGGLAFPNGLALTADGRTLYVCESQLNRILCFDIHADGSLGELGEFASLESSGPGEPDGMAVDVRGHLWIAHYGAHVVLELDTAGRIVGRIQMPIGSPEGPTNVEFGDSDLKTLYITDPSTSALFKIRMNHAGLPLFCSPTNRAN